MALVCPKVSDDGLTQLWPPKDTNTDVEANIEADICFVHGLMGHPRNTWQYGTPPPPSSTPKSSSNTKSKILKISNPFRQISNASEAARRSPDSQKSIIDKSVCFWPFDLLRKDFGTLRIFTYGYDSHPTHFYWGKTTQMNITQHARRLLQHVTDRRAECRERPIIFVGHSLGGILIKDAIIQAGKFEQQPKFQDLATSCFAIIFFGTPHLGANAAVYGEMVATIVGSLPGGVSVYKEILRGLQPDGEKLSNVNADFNDLLNKAVPADQKIKIYSFQEGKPISSVKRFDGKVIPDTSSFFNRRDIEQNSFISGNHMEMCRFKNAEVCGYNDFKNALAEYLRAMGLRAEDRRNQADQQRTVDRQALVESLNFKEHYVREQQISSSVSTIKKSFLWVWNSLFSDWLKNDESLFWIAGKPASGKSTLMHYIANEQETVDILKSSAYPRWKVIYFFFDFRADKGISNSFEGMLRYLTIQLLKKVDVDEKEIGNLRHVIQRYISDREWQMEGRLTRRAIPIQELRESFEKMLQKLKDPLLILLDGLDEYEGNKYELVNFIKKLCRPKIKICLACRPDPPFPDAFESIPSLDMHKLNTSGIRVFTEHYFHTIFPSSAEYDKRALQSLTHDIASRAQGVFLWARYSTFELIDGITRGEGLRSSALRSRLDGMPKELDQIYSRIFARGSPNSRATAGLILLLVCYCRKLLTIGVMREAIRLVVSEVDMFRKVSLRRFEDLGTDQDVERSFKKIVLADTGGTVETYVKDFNQKPNSLPSSCVLVRLAHRTVKTYLDSKGWAEILGKGLDLWFGDEIWLRACVKTITVTDKELLSILQWKCWERIDYYRLLRGLRETGVSDGGGYQSHASQDRCALLAYAVVHMFDHASSFEDMCHKSSYYIMHPALTECYLNLHMGSCSAHGTCLCWWLQDCTQPPEPVFLATSHGLCYFVSDYLEKHASVPWRPLRKTRKHGFLSSFSRTPVTLAEVTKDYALGYACQQKAKRHIATLKVALRYDQVTDEDVLRAIGRGTTPIVAMLLEPRQPGKILLASNWDIDIYEPDRREHVRKHNFGPFCAIANRYASQATEDMISFFISRGEDINERCGPSGGVLHSYIDKMHRHFHLELVDLLVQKGLRINGLAGSPYGNPLEYLWMKANTSTGMETVGWRRITIRQFLDLGAVNNRRDPNGLVPSVEQMKHWGRNPQDHLECKRYYLDGPKDGAQGG